MNEKAHRLWIASRHAPVRRGGLLGRALVGLLLLGPVVGPVGAVTPTPASLSFGSQRVGTTSAAQSVTITNSATFEVEFRILIDGRNLGDFVILNNPCPYRSDPSFIAIPASGSCTIEIAFTPQAAGSRSADLCLREARDYFCLVTVPLSGTGIAPVITLSPAALDFGNQPLGTGSAAQTITVANTGTAPLLISSVGISGDFALTALPASPVPAGGSTTISVNFTPQALGFRTGQITITSDADGSPHLVPLSGTGTAHADLAISMGADPNPAKKKDNVTYSLVVTNAGPSTATGVTLTDALPADCAFVSAETTHGTLTGPAVGTTGTLTANLGSLENGESAVVTVVVQMTTRKTSVSNSAVVSSSTMDLNPANNSASVNVTLK